MEVYECIRGRRTVRRFRPDPVPDALVDKILRAGRWAPSSRNLQPWHFVVVKDPDTLRKLGEIATSGPFIADAPVAIAVAMENADRADLDAGRVIQQMELVAWAEGLGTCFVGFRVAEQNEQVKQLLGIPEPVELVTVLPFGYRAEAVAGGGQRRRPLSEIAHSERFGQSYSAAETG